MEQHQQHPTMKLAHNIRLNIINRTPQEQTTITEAISNWLEAPIKNNIKQQTLEHPGLDTLYTTSIVLDRQPLVRTTLQKLRALPQKDQEQLLATAHLRLDEHNNFFFRINKTSIIEGTPRIAEHGDTIQVRITLSAHPKNKENAVHTIKQVFDKRTNL